ncbi:MAG: cell division protein FtsQ/DivIB [Lachnospiraceae bacterium]|nr:cell division protein FtsQ/DivIB [Lachnospiraceae bacterium]
MKETLPDKKKIGVLAAVVILLLLVLLIVSVKITHITVTGNERYTDEQMIALLFPDNVSRNAGVCYLKDRLQEHEKIPFVEDYKLVFQGPNRVEVIVYEKSVVGYVSYMSSYMYFDKDGIIVESANQMLPGIPWITGLKFGQIVLYQKLPVGSQAVFDEILNLTQILSIYGLQVDRIQYNSFGEANLYMGDIEVVLGSNDSLNGKIAELNDMIPQLTGLSGTLYLDTYDETNSGAMYAFKPKK